MKDVDSPLLNALVLRDDKVGRETLVLDGEDVSEEVDEGVGEGRRLGLLKPGRQEHEDGPGVRLKGGTARSNGTRASVTRTGVETGCAQDVHRQALEESLKERKAIDVVDV